MRALRDAGIVLEVCPTSNLLTKALADEDAVRDTIRTLADNRVRFTIATDGPEMMHTHLSDEFDLLERIRRPRPRRARGGERAWTRGRLSTSKGVARKFHPAEELAPAAISESIAPCSPRTPQPDSRSGSGRSSSSSPRAAPTRRSQHGSGSRPGRRRRTATACGRSSASRGDATSRSPTAPSPARTR